jgi:hypothetical protein
MEQSDEAPSISGYDRRDDKQIRVPSNLPATRHLLESNGVKVISAPFPFKGDTPLSWHLYATEKANVRKAWKTPADDIVKAKKDVFAAVGCQARRAGGEKSAVLEQRDGQNPAFQQ